jgi:hypothetical protein
MSWVIRKTLSKDRPPGQWPTPPPSPKCHQWNFICGGAQACSCPYAVRTLCYAYTMPHMHAALGAQGCAADLSPSWLSSRV